MPTEIHWVAWIVEGIWMRTGLIVCSVEGIEGASPLYLDYCVLRYYADLPSFREPLFLHVTRQILTTTRVREPNIFIRP